MLGLVLFIICINDLDVNAGSMIRKLTINIRTGSIVDSAGGYSRLQYDLDQLGKWAKA